MESLSHLVRYFPSLVAVGRRARQADPVTQHRPGRSAACTCWASSPPGRPARVCRWTPRRCSSRRMGTGTAARRRAPKRGQPRRPAPRSCAPSPARSRCGLACADPLGQPAAPAAALHRRADRLVPVRGAAAVHPAAHSDRRALDTLSRTGIHNRELLADRGYSFAVACRLRLPPLAARHRRGLRPAPTPTRRAARPRPRHPVLRRGAVQHRAAPPAARLTPHPRRPDQRPEDRLPSRLRPFRRSGNKTASEST